MKLIELFEDTIMQDTGTISTDGNSRGDKDLASSLPPYLKDRYDSWRYSDKLAKAFDNKFGRRDDNPIVNRGLNKYTLDWIISNPHTTTAYYTEVLPLDPKKLLKIEGFSGEHNYIDKQEHKERISGLAQDMRDNGFDRKSAILIQVTPHGPKIIEGNHRVRAAVEANLRVIPVEWRWLGGTELNRMFHPVQYVNFKTDESLNEEHIVQTAFRMPNGTVIPSGPFHNIEVIPDELLTDITLDNISNGFLTDEGNYLTRKEAARLTKMKKPRRQQGALHSFNVNGLGRHRPPVHNWEPEKVSGELV